MKISFYKIIKHFLLLVVITCPVYAQKGVSEELDNFYRIESQNWIDKKVFEQNFLIDTTTDTKFYHIFLDVSIDSPYISGNVLYVTQSRINNLEQLVLDLTDSLRIDSLSGSVSSYTHADDRIIIQLDRNYNQGETISINIYYSGIPPLLNQTKGMNYETHNNSEPIIATLSTPYLAHLWYPCKDGPGDKADSVYMDITIPDTVINNNRLVAVSNGLLDDISVENGKRTFRWRERYPIIPYYVMIAISNYSNFQQTINDSLGSFPVIYNVFKPDSINAVQGTIQLPDAINFFSGIYGLYPFRAEKYGMTQLGFYGAIENQTNTIQNTIDIYWTMISVHELSHMWFGDMITCANWHHGWLNEGFATYSEALYREHTDGFDAYKIYLQYYKYLDGGTVYLQNTEDPFQIFIDIIYSKGAWVLHMLRGTLGDEVFFNCIKQYATDPRFKYKHASTEDFQSVCENVSGQDLDYFFDQWIYDEYYPIYNCAYNYDQSAQILNLQLSQSQSQNGWRSVFKMPVRIKLHLDSGTDTLVTLWNDQQIQDYQLNLSRKVQNLYIDPDQWILRKVGTISAVSGIYPEQPLSFKLFDNYPNPFNPATKIMWSTPVKDHNKLIVYDVLGNEVAKLIDEEKEAGKYEVEFDASRLSSGIYFCKLSCGSFTETKKMLLIK